MRIAPAGLLLALAGGAAHARPSSKEVSKARFRITSAEFHLESGKSGVEVLASLAPSYRMEAELQPRYQLRLWTRTAQASLAALEDHDDMLLVAWEGARRCAQVAAEHADALQRERMTIAECQQAGARLEPVREALAEIGRERGLHPLLLVATTAEQGGRFDEAEAHALQVAEAEDTAEAWALVALVRNNRVAAQQDELKPRRRDAQLRGVLEAAERAAAKGSPTIPLLELLVQVTGALGEVEAFVRWSQALEAARAAAADPAAPAAPTSEPAGTPRP